MQTLTRPTFPVDITFDWTEQDVIPPRCRNPRDVCHADQTHSVSVPQITADDFPIAFRSHIWRQDEPVEYRMYEGSTYQPYKPYSRQVDISIAGSDHFPTSTREHYGLRTHSFAEATAQLEAKYARFLIVDGEVWLDTDILEPFYTVQVHDGWAQGKSVYLNIAERHRASSEDKAWTHFNANERDAAIAYALAQIPEHKHAETLARFAERDCQIEVLMPDAVTYFPDRDTAKGANDLNSLVDFRLKHRALEAGRAAIPTLDAAAFGRGELGEADFLLAVASQLTVAADQLRNEAND